MHINAVNYPKFNPIISHTSTKFSPNYPHHSLNYRVFCIWYVKCSAAATHRPVWQYSQLPNLFSECLQLFFNFWLVYVASSKVKFSTTTATARRETIVIIVKIITKCVSFQERKNKHKMLRAAKTPQPKVQRPLKKRHRWKRGEREREGKGKRGSWTYPAWENSSTEMKTASFVGPHNLQAE